MRFEIMNCLGDYAKQSTDTDSNSCWLLFSGRISVCSTGLLQSHNPQLLEYSDHRHVLFA